MRALLREIQGEEGHIAPAVGGLVGAIGAVLLGIGAAADTGWLAVGGGIVAGVGLLAGNIYGHMEIDYKVWERLDNLEKK